MNTRAGMIPIKERPKGILKAYRFYWHGRGDHYVWKIAEGVWCAGAILGQSVVMCGTRGDAVESLQGQRS